MFCKGLLVGTTYSGDPSATSNCGTGRNLSYHLFGIWKAKDRFKMAPIIEALPKKRFDFASGNTDERP